MKANTDGAKGENSLPLILDIDDFKGDFSFDALFGNLVNDLLPSFQEEDTESTEGSAVTDDLPKGHLRVPSDMARAAQGTLSPLFPEVESLLSLFKDSSRELIDLTKQIDTRLLNLKKEVSAQDSKHQRTFAELEKGVDGLFDSFARLDSRISSVGQTTAKIGDHLQSADSQRETASQTIELIKYLMEFNSSPGDLIELSPLFSDDSRVAEAASVAQKLSTQRPVVRPRVPRQRRYRGTTTQGASTSAAAETSTPDEEDDLFDPTVLDQADDQNTQIPLTPSFPSSSQHATQPETDEVDEQLSDGDEETGLERRPRSGLSRTQRVDYRRLASPTCYTDEHGRECHPHRRGL